MFNDFSSGEGGGGNGVLIDFQDNALLNLGTVTLPDMHGHSSSPNPAIVVVLPTHVMIRDCFIMPKPWHMPLRLRLRMAWRIIRAKQYLPPAVATR